MYPGWSTLTPFPKPSLCWVTWHLRAPAIRARGSRIPPPGFFHRFETPEALPRDYGAGGRLYLGPTRHRSTCLLVYRHGEEVGETRPGLAGGRARWGRNHPQPCK